MLIVVYFSFYDYFCELFSDHPDWDVKKEYIPENLKVIPEFLLFNFKIFLFLNHYICFKITCVSCTCTFQ